MEIWWFNVKYIIDHISLKCNSFYCMQVVAWLRAEHRSSFTFIYHNSRLKATQIERPYMDTMHRLPLPTSNISVIYKYNTVCPTR